MTPGRAVFSFVAKNFWLKLVSVCFALVLFLIVRTEQVREFNLTGRVKIVTSKDVVVVGARERAVELQIKLPNALFSVPPSEEQLTGLLDVSEQSVGRVRIRLSRYNFPSLDDRYLVNVIDPWIEVDLDEVITKRVPVRAVLQGLPAEGLSVERVLLNPEEIEVFGAKREVEVLETISTSPLNIAGIDQNFSAITKLELNESTSVQVPNDKVNVQVYVGRNFINRVFQKVPVSVRNGKKTSGPTEPGYVVVELRGPAELLQRLTSSSVRAYVDAMERPAGKVWVEVPEGTSLVSVAPEEVVLRDGWR
jgi:YbbR domain-containing protein